ncbi:lytic transglycosylase domain-containing protein [Burkholderia gladioli]|uniref:lytic transglycosylase domain-containing protein n=1 Tax=Burkholderia gladioli TaxID=28095 RepID=UPI00164047B0|nr:lytic transglycosylase domain-containing protein [Burkholderia gladioli]
MMRIFVLAALLLATRSSFAQDCLIDAARYQNVDPILVLAIARHESGMRADAVNRNSNGSVDLGLMQINSRWLPALRSYGVDAQQLMDPCVNSYGGVWILKQAIARYGATWQAVGAYNAASPAKQQRYIARIYPLYIQYARLAAASSSVSAP